MSDICVACVCCRKFRVYFAIQVALMLLKCKKTVVMDSAFRSIFDSSLKKVQKSKFDYQSVFCSRS